MNKFLQSAVSGLLFGGLVLGLPLVTNSDCIDSYLTPRIPLWGLVLLLCTALLIALQLGGVLSTRVLRARVWRFVAVYLLAGLVSAFVAHNRSEWMHELLRIYAFAGTALAVALTLATNSNSWVWLRWCAAIAMLLWSVVGFTQLAGLELFHPFPGNIKPYATFGAKNLFASATFLLLPWVVDGIMRERGWKRMVFVLALATGLFHIGFGLTRAVYLGSAVGGTVIAVYLAIAGKQNGLIENAQTLKIVRIATGVVLVAGLAATWPIYQQIESERGLGLQVRDKSLFEVNSLNERIQNWENSVEMAVDHPLLGVGLGQWKIENPRYGLDGMLRTVREGKTIYSRPHNDFLWVVTETGQPGLVGFLGMFIVLVLSCIVTIRHTKDQRVKWRSLLLLGALVGFAVISCLSFPRERAVQLVLFAILIGAVAAMRTTVGSNRNTGKVVPVILLVLMAVVGGSTACIGLKRLQAEQTVKQALDDRQREAHKRVISRIGAAESPYYTLDPTGTPIAYYSGLSHLILGEADQALVDFRTAKAHNPTHLHLLANIGTAHSATGNQQAAEAAFLELLEIQPQFSDALLNLTAIYYNAGRYEDAKAMLDRFPRDKSNDTFEQYRQAVMERLEQR